MTDTSAEVATPTKKARNVENFYVDSKGERAARPQPDVVSIGKKFLESGHEIVKDLSSLGNEQLRQSAAFGLQQVGQNAYGAAADEDERIEMLEARWDSIWAGQWASDRQVGPRTSDLVEAFAQAKADKEGRDPGDSFREMVRGKLDSGEVTAKSLQENPLIKAKLEAIKAKRAAERAANSAKAAADATETALPDL